MAFRVDRSALEPALLEFAVVADSHYMVDPGGRHLEFESRRRQSARTAWALRQVAALSPAFVVHLGDLVQASPGSPDFEGAVEEALAQVRACGLERLHYVAGNHDVGDKPDPTMPTAAVAAADLAAYAARRGPSWYSVEYPLPGQDRPLALVVLNSQILNSPLRAAAQQASWLESELRRRHRQRARVVLALHLPPYLGAPDEPGLGHYDNVGEPARAWLLDLMRQFPPEALFAGHVHFAFRDAVGPTAWHVAPSTSFTRPGFGHLFASAPAPERGRDDGPKLGFLWCRVLGERLDVHFIRTGGQLQDDGEAQTPERLLTPGPRRDRDGGIGVTLTQPLGQWSQVPLAWPSAVRQPVRNDYPLLACLELGAAGARVPARDLEDPAQHGRLRLLRSLGVPLQATELWEGPASAARLARVLDQGADGGAADTGEIQLPGAALPEAACLQFLRQAPGGGRLALCPVLPGQVAPGKQHPRTRLGYRPAELADLGRCLAAAGVRVGAALCRLEAGAPVPDQVTALGRCLPAAPVDRLDLLLALPGEDDEAHARLAAEAAFAAALLPGSRLFLEPLVDLDRTMDAAHGLLDGLCNPRSPLTVLRCLNAVLFAAGRRWVGWDTGQPGVPGLAASDGLRVALYPAGPPGRLPDPDRGWRLWDLAAATVIPLARESLATVRVHGPVLLVTGH
ncbi:MAG: metallophosphoesterase [Gemmatimonadota bacterium]